MNMKRITFIVLWTVVFAVLTLIAGMVGFSVLGHFRMETWNQSTVVRVGESWAIIFFGMPVVGFILGLFDKLPGTKQIKR